MTLNGRSFFLGTNYYPSQSYDRFWLHPDFSELNRDFSRMKKMNLSMLRMHYIHSDWYRDFNTRFLGNRLEGLTPDPNPLDTASQILHLAQSQGLMVCFDLFSLVPENMGACEGWKNDVSRFMDPNKIEAQNEFLLRFLEKTKDNSNVTIDLVNEPDLPEGFEPAFTRWVDEKVKIIKSLRPQILVTVGFEYPGIPVSALDYYSIHCDRVPPLPFHDKPMLLQEFWASSKRENFSEEKAWKKFMFGIHKAQKQGYAGMLPWGFSSPATLYETEGASEKWESQLGIFCRADGSWKHVLPWMRRNGLKKEGTPL